MVSKAEVGDASGTQAARLQSPGLARVTGEDLLIDQLGERGSKSGQGRTIPYSRLKACTGTP